MDISNHRPFIWPLVRLFFPTAKWGQVVVTWGKTIYVKGYIPDDILAHEAVHGIQQRMSKIIGAWWWVKYILSSKFRLSQEIPAHKKQYETACGILRNRDARYRAKMRIAVAMSSDVYKNMISYEDAIKSLE